MAEAKYKPLCACPFCSKKSARFVIKDPGDDSDIGSTMNPEYVEAFGNVFEDEFALIVRCEDCQASILGVHYVSEDSIREACDQWNGKTTT